MNRRYSRVESSGDLKDYFDRGDIASRENRWTFEIAWEVANKVGGIYTVIRSKAYVSTEEMGEQLCLMGPYKENCARTEIEEMEFPRGNPLLDAVNTMRSRGYKIHTGRWLVDGNPQLILFDIGSGAWKMDQFKSELWEKCHIGKSFISNFCFKSAAMLPPFQVFHTWTLKQMMPLLWAI